MSPSPTFIGLVLLDVLLLWLLVKLPVRSHWGAKACATVLVLAFNFFVWSAQDSGKGWPVGANIPEPAAFVSCVVNEPSAESNGAIYVWVIPLKVKDGVLGYQHSSGEPRAYREPYDRSLHEACVAAAKAAGQGQHVGLHKGKGHGPRGTPGHTGQWHAYVLPSTHLPSKGGS